MLNSFDFCFAENGLTAYKLGQQLESQSFIKHLGEDKYKPLVNFILHYIADMDIPIKRSVQQRVGCGRPVSVVERAAADLFVIA